MEKRKKVLAPWRVVFWIVPVLVAVLSVGMHACGSDDDDGCSDSTELPNFDACEVYAEANDCGDFTYDDNTGVCTVSDCVCVIFDDDDDDI